MLHYNFEVNVEKNPSQKTKLKLGKKKKQANIKKTLAKLYSLS